MKARLLFLASLVIICSPLWGQSSSPEARAITDPKSVTSVSSPDARPVPIEDLFYTRSVFDPT
jgi:hypothetical protein